MKRTARIILISGVLLLGGYFFFGWFFNQPCIPPAKPKDVPIQAEWFGGCDGGNWIQLVSTNDEKYRFRIYRDWDGNLQMDADFVVKECNGLTLDHSNFAKVIAYYSLGLNDEVRLEVRSETGQQINCYLELAPPAYGGEDWDVVKEKQSK